MRQRIILCLVEIILDKYVNKYANECLQSSEIHMLSEAILIRMLKMDNLKFSEEYIWNIISNW